ncbi:MAG: hypothetical protein R6X08_13155 [Desulfosalsimonadaceae bacterium]
MRLFSATSVLICISLAMACTSARAFEIEGRYSTISCAEMEALEDFNYELYMGRLKSGVRGGDTIKEEVGNKLDFIVEKVMQVLDMYLPKISFKIVIHGSKEGVQASFQKIYNQKVNYIAFFSPSENTVFLSARDADLPVVAHEIGHVVAEHYFNVSPPARIHEVMAQYAEKHVTD